ncbi:hypothetical protein AAFC00_004563 [Neodothiora populina]|uniref:Protein kinase domain-containing protein n=1 Tax=Neodothiora populina TaxID=2781224 RepID=A0ABR3P2N0_9PEZI
MSFDAASLESEISRSPGMPERDSGLRRIRQVVSNRQGTLSARSSSHNLRLASAGSVQGIMPSGPSSPTLPFSEDLSRFPSESLHSFSFAHQSEDSLHNRQTVLKRSMDFMRDKLGWAAVNPNIMNAQAKISGDHEVQSMVELLQRANLLGPDGNLNAPGIGITNAPLSGPADPSADNIFDRSFAPISESPKSTISPLSEENTKENGANVQPSSALPENHADVNATAVGHEDSRMLSTDSLSPPMPKRASLKRTYTDIGALNMQNRLSEAMAQPYHAPSVSQDPHALSSKSVPTFPPTGAKNTAAQQNQSGPSHGHGHGRQAAAHQAIFTTEAKSPWTITAANDLACLVFGVTRAEVRKMGIMEVIREERRKWLEKKLRGSDADSPGRGRSKSPQRNSQQSSADHSKSPSSNLSMGTGVTAKLLSKPPVRQNYQSRRSKTVNGIDDDKAKNTAFHSTNASRGVLLCGDVVPIQKRNGDIGSASLWVKEKSGGLIWVLEEIAEDVAYLTVDEIGCIDKSVGALEAIWGVERVRRGTDVRKLLPELPKLAGTHTGALDLENISELRRFTARTANSISIPVTIDLLSGESTLRVSSFPHIAGILVISADTLKVASSNSVFSAALFGIERPEDLDISDLIPSFDKILHLLTDEDKIRLEDGLVIPEHSFRRARALLALREGRADAASIFLRPSGLPAKHRDGSDIMIDVQMRVVKSDRHDSFNSNIIAEEHEEVPTQPSSEVVYALWITYSRALHAVNHGVGPVNPLISRPGSPTRRSIPGQPVQPLPAPTEESDESSSATETATSANSSSTASSASLLTQQLQDPSTATIFSADNTELFEHPSPDAEKAGVKTTKKKLIADFLILEEMGQGAYGQVKLARYKKANAQKMVIKYVTKRRILVDTWTRDRRLGTVPLEIHVLDYLRRDGLMHPNIVEMADFFEDDINYYIEMIPHGLPGMDLFDYIELRVNMEEKECRKIFVQVASAIDHLHNKARVVHRDIKDENVILDGDGAVKLVDFGSAAYIKSGPFDVFVGTIDYAAPEVLRGSPYRGKEQDVWALGILLYTIVYKENPFYSIDEIMDHDLRVPYVMSEDCIDLIRKMLDRDVERRIGIQAVLEHPWSTHVDEEEE